MSDFKNRVAYQAGKEFQARRAALYADLAAHENNEDEMSGSQTLQELAKLEVEERAAADIYQRHLASQQPRQPEYLTPEERQARPVHRMDWTDVVDLTRQSRYQKHQGRRSSDGSRLA